MHSQVHHAGCITLAAAGVALSPPGLAAEQSSQSMAFYALGVALDGAVTVGERLRTSTSAPQKCSTFSSSQPWIYRYQTEPWSLQVDVIYASLTGEDGAQGGARAKVDLDQAMIEINGGYRVHENIELIAGARYWEYETDIGLFTTGAATQRAAGDESWLDPLIGARLTIPIGSNWEFVARGDIGGFGVGSDFVGTPPHCSTGGSASTSACCSVTGYSTSTSKAVRSPSASASICSRADPPWE